MILLAVENILEIMRTLSESEWIIGQFYRRCAETWKMDEGFWLKLEGEEIRHAKALEAMADLIRQNPDAFQLNRPFSVTAIKTVITGVGQNIDQLNKGLIKRERAMVLARDIESSIIEKAYHEIVKTTNPTYLALVRQVVSESYNHRNSIEQKIRETSSQPPGPGR